MNKSSSVLRFVRLSTLHMTRTDALTLSRLTDENVAGEKWIYPTGKSGFLIALDAWPDTPAKLEALGVGRALCDTLRLLETTLKVRFVHFDVNAEVLSGIPVYTA